MNKEFAGASAFIELENPAPEVAARVVRCKRKVVRSHVEGRTLITPRFLHLDVTSESSGISFW